MSLFVPGPKFWLLEIRDTLLYCVKNGYEGLLMTLIIPIVSVCSLPLAQSFGFGFKKLGIQSLFVPKQMRTIKDKIIRCFLA